MKKPGKMFREAFSHLLKKPATIKYPFVKSEMPDNFRGKLIFDQSSCIGCKICMKDCPAFAITITKIADKVFDAFIDLDKCIYCAQCVDSCPKNALHATKDFELAQLDKNKLKVNIMDPSKPKKIEDIPKKAEEVKKEEAPKVLEEPKKQEISKEIKEEKRDNEQSKKISE